MTDLMNESGLGGNEVYTNYILKGIQKIFSRVGALVESTEIVSMRINE